MNYASNKGNKGLFLPLLIGVALAWAIFYLQNRAGQYFTKWKTVFDDFDVAFPKMEFLMEYKLWIVAIPSICILLFTVSFLLSKSPRKSMLSIGAGLVAISSIPFLLSLDMWARQLPAEKAAAELGLNSIPKRSDSAKYLNSLGSSSSPEEQSLAAAKLRFIGLQYRIQLVDRIEPDVIEGLIEIASNSGHDNQRRFLAAWVLLVADRESSQAKEAIHLAMKAAADDGDLELKSRANDIIDLMMLQETP